MKPNDIKKIASLITEDPDIFNEGEVMPDRDWEEKGRTGQPFDFESLASPELRRLIHPTEEELQQLAQAIEDNDGLVDLALQNANPEQQQQLITTLTHCVPTPATPALKALGRTEDPGCTKCQTKVSQLMGQPDPQERAQPKTGKPKLANKSFIPTLLGDHGITAQLSAVQYLKEISRLGFLDDLIQELHDESGVDVAGNKLISKEDLKATVMGLAAAVEKHVKPEAESDSNEL